MDRTIESIEAVEQYFTVVLFVLFSFINSFGLGTVRSKRVTGNLDWQ